MPGWGEGWRGLGDVATTMVVNVGDDEVAYGLHVSPDLDTVLYTLAGIEGPEGWGRADDTWEVMGHLAELGVDTAFAIGDSDLATNLYRTLRLRQRETLSNIVSELVTLFGVTVTVLPASDQPVRTEGRDRRWGVAHLPGLLRQSQPPRRRVGPTVRRRFLGPPRTGCSRGARRRRRRDRGALQPAALHLADTGGSRDRAGGGCGGPGDRESPRCSGARRSRDLPTGSLPGLAIPSGNAGVIAAYDGLLTDLVIDRSDADEAIALRRAGLSIHVADTRIGEPERAELLARWLVELMT